MSLEEAILLEGEEAGQQSDSLAEIAVRDAQQALDRPWSELEQEATADEGFRLDGDLRIIEVGTATLAGDRSVRLPLTLGNSKGERAQLSLTIALDPLLDPET